VSERLQGALFRRNPIGAAALTLVGLALGVWAVINSPIFGIERILVEGARELSSAEVRELAGVDRGTNLVRLPLESVAASIERSPWVRDAAAGRTLPTTLVLRIAERRPVGWVQDPAGPAVVAEDGIVVSRAEPAPADLPALGIVAEPMAPGEQLGGVITLAVAASMPDRLLSAVATVAEADGGVVLELRGGGRVEYGAPQQLPAKNRALIGMLAWAAERGLGIDSIDVRIPSAPALRPATSAG
jgi:cell division protein FtsQ